MSSGLLQVFVELGNLHGTSNYVLYWNHGGRLFWFRLPWPGTSVKYSCKLLASSEDWTSNPVVSIKDVVRSFEKVPEFDKHLKKAGGHIGRNVVEITIKMKTIVRKTLMIKINKLRLRNLDNIIRFVSYKRPN